MGKFVQITVQKSLQSLFLWGTSVSLVAILASMSSAQAMECEEVIKKIQSSRSENSSLRKASSLLNRSFTDGEIDGIRAAHSVGANMAGKSGLSAGLGNYTWRQIRIKARYLRNAGFTKSEIRILMENSIVGSISEEQIQAALQAELGQPTDVVEIRQSGTIEQYHALDSPEWHGKFVLVKIIEDAYLAGRKDGHMVPQLILTKDFLDLNSQRLVEEIKVASTGGVIPFQEVGGWMLYTQSGVYKSTVFSSNDPYMLANDNVLLAFDEAYKKAEMSEGSNPKFQDIEFYHTHLERGEVFTHGDRDFQKSHFRIRNLNAMLLPGGTFASYAVPLKGQVLFRSAIRGK